MDKKRRMVQFNADEVALYESLGTSQPFSKFVKDAFYEKIDTIRLQSQVENLRKKILVGE
tara:strand:+ start:79 stop:258 length:180 start_codon:yes stop_codon:yes gene_type:complete